VTPAERPEQARAARQAAAARCQRRERLAIPTDNPSRTEPRSRPRCGRTGCAILAVLIRSPDRDLYIGDVGQNRTRKSTVSTTSAQRGRGVNFGWNIMEGLHCYR